MAYDSANLSALAYANGFTLWHYTTTDAAAVVDSSGYFNGAANQLRVSDIILAKVGTAGAVNSVGIFAVQSNAAGVVDVFDLTSASAVDTD